MAEYLASCRFPPDDKSAEGHFPGNPIIPGAVLLREIVAAIAIARPRVPEDDAHGNAVPRDGAIACREIRSAKFHLPVRPGDTLFVGWTETTAGVVRFSCVLAGSSRPAVTGVLVLARS